MNLIDLLPLLPVVLDLADRWRPRDTSTASTLYVVVLASPVPNATP